MEKVKVNKEVFEALENLKQYFRYGIFNKEVVIHNKIHKYYKDERKVLNDLDFELFLDIITHGYELEKTEEERKQELFLIYNNNLKYGHTENMCFARGIRKTLEVLGIKVEGINV